jgi:hypothetical protein
MKKATFLFIFLLLFSCERQMCGCIQPVTWIDKLINEGKDSTGTLESVYTYNYNNKQVYLVNYKIECCDNFTAQLFDNEGKSLCFPYGGITGKGDIKCQEFDNQKSQEKLYWKK